MALPRSPLHGVAEEVEKIEEVVDTSALPPS